MRRFTGQPDGGTIFRLNTDGSGYAVLKYFGVRAIPSELSYQWFLNDRAIIGATGSSLRLTNLLFGQSGSYTVVITNAFGAVTSGPGDASSDCAG